MEGGRKMNRTNFQKLDIEVEALQMKKQSPNPQGKAKTNSFKYFCTAKKKKKPPVKRFQTLSLALNNRCSFLLHVCQDVHTKQVPVSY